MQSTIDKTPIKNVLENGVSIFVQEQLDSITASLEYIIKQDSVSGHAVDDLRKIQCIIDEARKAETNTKISINSKQHIALEKVTQAIEASKDFLQKYKGEEIVPLQKAIFDLDNILNAFREKLSFLSEKSHTMKEALKIITGTPNLNKDSSKKVFEKWAQFIEIFAEWLEDVTDILDIPLETIEKCSRDILSLLSEKSNENHKKDEYKRRLRFSATYIIKVIIDEKNFSSDRELEREGYTIVKDLRSLAHAQYKITMSQMMTQVNAENIKRLDDDVDVDVDLDKIFHGRKNTAMR